MLRIGEPAKNATDYLEKLLTDNLSVKLPSGVQHDPSQCHSVQGSSQSLSFSFCSAILQGLWLFEIAKPRNPSFIASADDLCAAF